AARLRRLALRWLDHNRVEEAYWPELRFDVVSVVRLARGGPSVRHLKAAF
ncbi:MAG: hypothetical protein JWO57_1284, partial [Pseudonocardiales bacterium]|nr:hypothetical protein [Pseudonocardiales bacterium]